MKKVVGFTLVELLVVVTILALLATIAFISINGYTSNARDSVKISNINEAKKALEVSILTKGFIPEPDNYISLYEGDISKKIVNEGYFGQNAYTNLELPKEFTALEDELFYSKELAYNKYELASTLENKLTLITTAKANADNIYRVGYSVNSVYKSDFTLPNTNIDILNVDTTKNYTYLSGNKLEPIPSNKFYQARPNYSCNKLLEMGMGGNTNAKIQPSETSPISVNCLNEFQNKEWTYTAGNNFDSEDEFARDYSFISTSSPYTTTISNGVLNYDHPADSSMTTSAIFARSFPKKDNEIYLKVKLKTTGVKRNILLDGYPIRYDDSSCVGICLFGSIQATPDLLTNKDEYSELEFYINKKDKKAVFKINGEVLYDGVLPSYSVEPKYVGKVTFHSRHFADGMEIDNLFYAAR